MPSWARSLIAVSAGLLVWLVAAPARAAAPLCDNRGAIMLAPAPVLDAPVASVDIGEPSDCLDLHAFEASLEENSRSGDPFPQAAHVDAATLTARLPFPTPSSVPAPVFSEPPCPLAGVRGRVERPPRG